MRIEEIQFKNFRKYVDTSIRFEKADNDIHAIIADNGVGKTTFLNAMTWCLYNEEPKIKDKKEALPTLNTDVSNNSENSKEEASVSLIISDNGDRIVYKRSDIYKIHSVNSKYYEDYGKREELIDQDFSVTEIIDNVSNIIRDEETCNEYVSSFIPESIKEFYFFDGEQLDNYFLSSSNIQDQVFTLSYIFLLDSMERRLKQKEREFRNKGSSNEKSDDKLKELNDMIDTIESEKDRLNKLTKAYNDKSAELDELMTSLGTVPSLTKLEEKREKKETLKSNHEKIIKEREKSLMDLIIKESPKILANKAFEKSMELIQTKRGQEDFIYQIDEDILTDSIEECSCKVCDRLLNDELIEYIKDKKAKLYLISPEEKVLKKHDKDFKNSLNISKKYLDEEKRLLNDISTSNETIDTLEEEIKQAYNTVKVHENERTSINKRDELVKILPEKKSELDKLSDHIKDLESQKNKIEKEYDKLCIKEKQNLDTIAKRRLCQESLKVIEKVKNDIMDETRQSIEDSTKSKFFELIRKTKAYSNVKITDNYEVKLFDENNRPALSSASASEKELLALSFTLAIHSISGYESPLVVDTLLARTSGVQRTNVAQGCLDVSKNKQILLFLLDDEYTKPVQDLFKANNVIEYNLIESESEKDLTIKRV